MKIKIAVPAWIAKDLEPFVGTKVRLTEATVRPTGTSTIQLIVSDKAVAHPPRP